jgi:hypothetical protein
MLAWGIVPGKLISQFPALKAQFTQSLILIPSISFVEIDAVSA